MSETTELFNSLLQLAVENGASDIHIKTNKPAFLRLHGRLEPVDMDPMIEDQIIEFIEFSVPPHFYELWRENSQIDYSYDLSELGLGRFRVNGFYQRGTPSMVFRHVKENPPSFEDLNHQPEAMKKLCARKDGILLMCGPTGSGKSSTMAAMLNYINQTMDKHVVTLEDPIEYNFMDQKAVFNQREVGIDVGDFASGLKAVLRQDPDIILIGEMRDRDTFETALQAAETGHLVFATIHASNAQQAVSRLFEFFPVDQQVSMRRQVASALLATITQRLIPGIEGGRVPAVEIMVVETLTRKIIEAGEFEKLPNTIEATREAGSKTFNDDLLRLIQDGQIARKEGLDYSPNPRALEMNLKGIFLSEGGLVG